jgi:glycogen(starch) synthase
MQVLIFSWEYPPRKIGQLAEYVDALSKKLVENGISTNVITYHDFLTGLVQEPNGVNIIRVANPIKNHISFLTWILTLNQEIERAAANVIYQQNKKINLINVHDWHFIPAAITIKSAFKIPIIYSIESLEDQRSQKSNKPYNMAIKSIEWLGCYEADKISVKTLAMKKAVMKFYSVPEDKIRILGSDMPKNIKELENMLTSFKKGKKKR